MTDSFTIYFAGDLFDHKHLIGNAILASYIESYSDGRYRCVVPQDMEQPTGRGVVIRNNDLRAVMECDLGLFNFDGADLDSGTVAEFMYAKMLDIPAVLFRSDLRSRGDSDRDPWNLMCSYYPRTEKVQFNGMALYKEVAAECGSVSETVEQLYLRVSAQLIDALDAVRQIKPLPNGGLENLATLYRWAVLFPGSGMDELLNEPGYVEQVIERKKRKGLL